jgi:hypothetical protein
VFYAIIDGVNIRIEKDIEEVKYACYQSDQRITGPCNLLFWEESILKHGDMFQVDGFEYEVNKYCMHDSCSQDGECDYCTNEIVLAKLKLAKEEEPKEQIDQDAWNELGNMINAQSELQDAFGVHPALDICKKYFNLTKK